MTVAPSAAARSTAVARLAKELERASTSRILQFGQMALAMSRSSEISSKKLPTPHGTIVQCVASRPRRILAPRSATCSSQIRGDIGMGALTQRDDLDDLIVAPSTRSSRTDGEIADDVARILDWTAPVPGSISASVDNGCVTLEGAVAFRYQKKAPERAGRRLAGVRTVDHRLE